MALHVLLYKRENQCNENLTIKGFTKWYISVIQDFWLFQMLEGKKQQKYRERDPLTQSFCKITKQESFYFLENLRQSL